MNKVQWEQNIFSVDKQLWCSKSLKSHELESRLCHLTIGKLCSKWVPVFDKPKKPFIYCASYSGPLTLTATLATRLWEPFCIPRPKGSGDIAMSLASSICPSVNIFVSAQ